MVWSVRAVDLEGGLSGPDSPLPRTGPRPSVTSLVRAWVLLISKVVKKIFCPPSLPGNCESQMTSQVGNCSANCKELWECMAIHWWHLCMHDNPWQRSFRLLDPVPEISQLEVSLEINRANPLVLQKMKMTITEVKWLGPGQETAQVDSGPLTPKPGHSHTFPLVRLSLPV